ncbi:hypothetical protein CKALI_11275 [Corynebacterium kalinowskii]|uniref:Tail assembly chaperone n=1 Tax=Corynebacterium kalinowskii TaxID=2675216 RepID=A0A6B8VJ81_9CORY|nr:hypothetical protein [Corynebacterium kalinowskii]QGU03099.1 hypothetical protein CKALI_11275 [Corynebacterium kalinowskii]
MTKKIETTDQFEEFLGRAKKLAKKTGKKQTSSVTDEPFVLGEDYGFTPEISIEKPVFSDRLTLAQAAQRQDTITCLRVFFKDDFTRFLICMNDMGDDAELITLGVVQALFEHFYGIGVDDAVGGFPMLSI